MNIEFIKNDLKNKIGRRVKVTVFGIRNHVNFYEGEIYKIYPNIFTIMYQGTEKSFSYRDIITKDISVKFI